ncbi:MAG: alpha/beta fold hydrolase [bacterium]|nr:alpha/beta fold hydrolase [bacterium]
MNPATCQQVTARANIKSSGTQLTIQETNRARLLEDGNVLFDSSENGITPGDNNNSYDVFLHDFATNGITLVATDRLQASTPNGSHILTLTGSSNLTLVDRATNTSTSIPNVAGGFAYATPIVSANGREIARSVLIPFSGVFLFDVASASYEEITVSVIGTSSTGFLSGMSDDARYVLFTSNATDLVTPPPPPANYLYLRDRTAGTTQIVSLSSTGIPTTAIQGFITADGTAVYFESATSPNTLFKRDLAQQTTTVVSSAIPDTLAVSRNGEHILYSNGSGSVWSYELSTQQTKAVSVGIGGAPENGTSSGISISDTGIACFSSNSSNLVAGDTNAREDVFVAAPARIEIVDAASRDGIGPQADLLFLVNGSVSNNPELLAQGGAPRIGCAADGTTQLLIRINSPYPADYSVSLPIPTTSYGALATVGGSFSQNIVSGSLASTTQGWRGYALYQAPQDFVRPGSPADPTAASRSVDLSVTLQTPTIESIEIRRPPVVLCHGLWSNRNTWANQFAPLKNGTDPLFESFAVDYSGSAGDGFFMNARHVGWPIQKVLNACRDKGIAATQADWVGHSMGGVLPRMHYRNAKRGIPRAWERSDNYLSGDINRLVLLNSPQWGSPWGSVLEGLAEDPTFGSYIDNALTAHGMPRFGAIRDLSEGSFAYFYIGATDIPTRAIIGTGCEVILNVGTASLKAVSNVVPGPFRLLAKIAGHLAQTVNDVYRGRQHDFAVLKESQEAGLATGQNGSVTELYSALGLTHHTRATSTATFYNELVATLNRPIAEYAHLPPPNPTPPSGQFNDSINLTLDALSIQLTAGTVGPGNQITVNVSGKNGFVPVECALAFPNDEATLSSAPFDFTITVPAEQAGELNLSAFAIDASGDAGASLPFSLPVSVPHQLNSIALSEDALTLWAPMARARLGVLGVFNDGIARDLAFASSGTTYSSSDPNVVSVVADGDMQAVGQGTATITVQNGTVSATCAITVIFAPSQKYGWSSQGQGNYFPDLCSAGGDPEIGNASFEYKVTDVIGGALGVLYQSLAADDQQTVIGQVWIDATTAVPIVVVATGAAGVPGAGEAVYGYPIPNDPTFVGLNIFAQAYFSDATTPAGWSTSNGLLITIQP